MAATAISFAAVGSTVLFVSACERAQPAVSQCAIVTGHGVGSGTQKVIAIAHPGDYVNVGNGNTIWYYPCDERNFIISPAGQSGDMHTPISVRTASQGSTPGMPVDVWLGVYFTPNQNNDAMKAFLPFCQKYGCAASDNDQVDNTVQNDPHFSTPGWEGMLAENFPFALQRAATQVISSFGPGLWLDHAQWSALGDDIAAQLNTELAQETASTVPFFCGGSSTQSKCTQMTVVINSVTPTDPEVQTLYNQDIAAQQAVAVNAARLSAAQRLYGPYAQYFLGLEDLANECRTCTIVVGQPNTIPSVPARSAG